MLGILLPKLNIWMTRRNKKQNAYNPAKNDTLLFKNKLPEIYKAFRK